MIRDWFRETFKHYRISVSLNEINETEKTLVLISQFLGKITTTFTNRISEYGWTTKINTVLYTDYDKLEAGDVIMDSSERKYQIETISSIKDNFGIIRYYKAVLNEYK